MEPDDFKHHEHPDEHYSFARELAQEANDMLPDYLYQDFLNLIHKMQTTPTDRRVSRFLAELICEEYGWPDTDLWDDHLTSSGWAIVAISEIAKGK